MLFSVYKQDIFPCENSYTTDNDLKNFTPNQKPSFPQFLSGNPVEKTGFLIKSGMTKEYGYL
jgi:hypothetical protein